MSEEHELKEIPYGIADFKIFSESNLYYVDKTRFIRDIEKKGKFLFFIRPRRFGKSLFLSMMEYYYDIHRQDQFDFLFKSTDIHANPTKEKNQYLAIWVNYGGRCTTRMGKKSSLLLIIEPSKSGTRERENV